MKRHLVESERFLRLKENEGPDTKMYKQGKERIRIKVPTDRRRRQTSWCASDNMQLAKEKTTASQRRELDGAGAGLRR